MFFLKTKRDEAVFCIRSVRKHSSVEKHLTILWSSATQRKCISESLPDVINRSFEIGKKMLFYSNFMESDKMHFEVADHLDAHAVAGLGETISGPHVSRFWTTEVRSGPRAA